LSHFFLLSTTDPRSEHHVERCLRQQPGCEPAESTPTPVLLIVLTGNVKIDEDMKYSSTHVFVTTNAAVGTDQDAGGTYYSLSSVEDFQQPELFYHW
jgi:hypothetical protein